MKFCPIIYYLVETKTFENAKTFKESRFLPTRFFNAKCKNWLHEGFYFGRHLKNKIQYYPTFTDKK